MTNDLDDTTPESGEAAAAVPAAEESTTASAPATPARRRSTGAKSGAKGGRAKSTASRSSSRPAKSAGRASSSRSSDSPRSAAGTLAAALRELVGGMEAEVENVSALSAQIDKHVEALNGLRADAAARLQHLDELRAAAEDSNLTAFLDDSIQPQLPQVAEDFPERIYGG